MFMGNRLSTILQEMPPSTWHHVPPAHNPADCASWAMSPRELVEHTLWWEGPKWLSVDPLSMPIQPLLGIDSTPELKVACTLNQSSFINWIDKCSNDYHKTLRLTAWCLCCQANLKLRKQNHPLNSNHHLTVSEIELAERFLFRETQAKFYSTEFEHLTQNNTVSSHSPLISLTPFIDKHGFICVGGRLSHSHLHHSLMHPVILPSKSVLCVKLLTHKHTSLGHCGPRLILSAAGNRVHIVSARRLARAVYRSCVTCRRATAKTQHQLMGKLPTSRLSPNPPFSICGVDYAGPFILKKGHTWKTCLIKCYLFLCVLLQRQSTLKPSLMPQQTHLLNV